MQPTDSGSQAVSEQDHRHAGLVGRRPAKPRGWFKRVILLAAVLLATTALWKQFPIDGLKLFPQATEKSANSTGMTATVTESDGIQRAEDNQSTVKHAHFNDSQNWTIAPDERGKQGPILIPVRVEDGETVLSSHFEMSQPDQPRSAWLTGTIETVDEGRTDQPFLMNPE